MRSWVLQGVDKDGSKQRTHIVVARNAVLLLEVHQTAVFQPSLRRCREHESHRVAVVQAVLLSVDILECLHRLQSGTRTILVLEQGVVDTCAAQIDPRPCERSEGRHEPTYCDTAVEAGYFVLVLGKRMPPSADLGHQSRVPQSLPDGSPQLADLWKVPHQDDARIEACAGMFSISRS